MEAYEAIISRRSIRRFKQKPVSIDVLKKLVNAGRLAPSAANFQPLEYIIVNEPGVCSEIFNTIAWAGYIKPRWTPKPDERPTAYIVMLVPKETSFDPLRDVGLSAENIMIAAEGEGFGSCMLMKIKREKIRKILFVPESFSIDNLIALGFKAEHPIVEDRNNIVEYWRDENDVLHVPKRTLSSIVHENSF